MAEEMQFFNNFLLSIYAVVSKQLSSLTCSLDHFFFFSSLCASGAGCTFPEQAELGVLLVVNLKQTISQGA